VRFVVLGKPVPLGRPRVRMVVVKDKKPFATVYTPPTSRKWMDLIRNVAAMEMRNKLWNPYSGLIAVTIEVTPQKLKSGKEAKRVGDLDNHIKAVLDALNGVAFKDDSQVQHITAGFAKAGPAGIEIIITEL